MDVLIIHSLLSHRKGREQEKDYRTKNTLKNKGHISSIKIYNTITLYQGQVSELSMMVLARKNNNLNNFVAQLKLFV